MRDSQVLDSLLDQFQASYAGAELRSVSARQDDRERLVEATLQFHRDPSLTGGGTQDYGRLVLWRKQLSVDQAKEVITGIYANEASPLFRPGCVYKINRHPSQHVPGPSEWPMPFHHGNRLSGYPERHFFFRCEEPGSFPRIPISKVGLQTVLDSDVTMSEWLGTDLGTNGGQNLLVVLPDFRARIKNIRIGLHEVEVQIESKLLDELKCELSYSLGGPVESQYQECLGGVCSWKVDAMPERLFILLHHESNTEVIDWAEVNPTSFAEVPGIEQLAPPELLEDALSKGEGQSIEFKKSVDGRTKEDITQSICAFANSDGGHLFVGVSDDGSVVGVAEPSKVAQKIRSWGHSRIEPPVTVLTRETQVEGKSVVIAEIPEGVDKPYRDLERKRYYIRRGEEEHDVVRSEMDAIYDERKGAHFPLPGKRRGLMNSL